MPAELVDGAHMDAGAAAAVGPSAVRGPGGATHASASSSTSAATPAAWPRSNPNPDRPANNAPPRTGVVQPTPQALPKRTGPSSIIVSPRQKGNPVLANIKSVPWEYGDIPADYVLGLTTCALFLSLKYHRLHPEYVYTRIKALQGKYNLRIVLVMVDIQNHEESLRELSKTSLINNVTLILCWSSAEGGRYLELFKSYENAPPTAIKQHQSSGYSERMIDFITTPRSINKTDAVSLVTQFGSLRTAVNAQHEEVARIGGWGDKKVQRWCASVREPFRIQRTAKRGISRDVTRQASENGEASPARSLSAAEGRHGISDADKGPQSRLANSLSLDYELFADDEAAMADAATGPAMPPKQAPEPAPKKRKADEESLSDGLMAALSKLREENG